MHYSALSLGEHPVHSEIARRMRDHANALSSPDSNQSRVRAIRESNPTGSVTTVPRPHNLADNDLGKALAPVDGVV